MLSHNNLRVVFIAWSKQWIFNVRIRLSSPLFRGLYFPDKLLFRNPNLARGIKQSTDEEGAQVEGGALLEIGPLAA